MNRELIFRAWHLEREEMYWFDLTWGQTGRSGSGWIGMLPIGEEIKYYSFLPDNRTLIDPDECDIMQFTGLLDKEDNKIFEGDVLRSVHFKEGNKTHYLYHIVKWDNRLSGRIAQNIDTRNGNFTDQGNPQIWVYMKNTDFDILGPIHDHPHLLKQTSNQ